jgi:MFS family permease
MFLFSHSCHGYVLLLVAALIGLGFGAIQSSSQAIAVNVTPPHRLGLANSTCFMFSDMYDNTNEWLARIISPVMVMHGCWLV